MGDFGKLSTSDEIEAPMWADLALECDSTDEDKDDEWFHVSHPFHQCSAKQLISKLSNSVECGMIFDLLGSSSPKLPPSVSKSRGKDYKSGKHEPVVCGFTLNKQNVSKSWSSRSLPIDAGSGKAITKKAFDGKVKDHPKYKPDPVGERTLPVTTTDAFTKSVSSSTDEKTSIKSVAFGGGSNSTSTITSDTAGWNLIKASSQSFGATSRSLLNLRDSLRKSYVTRQASRVVIKGVNQSEGQNSSSSKSSVRSSLQPGCAGMNKVGTNMDKMPDSRNSTTMIQLPTNKVNRRNAYKAPAAEAWSISFESNLIINRESSKTMGHKKHGEGCITKRVNKCILPATAKNSSRARGVNHTSKTVNSGKENQSRKMALGIKSSMMLKEAEGPLEAPKFVKRKVHQKSDRTKLVGQRENSSNGTKVKNSIRVVETVHFR
ncbi:uncharacterized protein LOC105174774 isoform X2 [Sesamum indicum]|uniref:Uncharacterized protein LOC105174774 isoform X2 n=1 Tax=Sesamum indicum TaxID=4182 RepID=A0A8M8VBM7_SESIN|nr:uncharacterized protein LOC105174774 isoform X2 [Sesamum indicum]